MITLIKNFLTGAKSPTQDITKNDLQHRKNEGSIMSDNRVQIYTTPICGYCSRAKSLLKKLDISFDEVNLFKEPGRKAEMMERSQRHTVPQIFIDGKSIGGSDELAALHRQGDLEKMLAAEPN